MSSRTVRNLVITAPDGTDVIDRTGGGYDTAGIVKHPEGQWSLVAHGWSVDSVRRRTRTRAGSLRDMHVGALWPQTAPVIRDYFGSHAVKLVQVFRPGEGWITPQTTDAGTSVLRKLAYAGVTDVAIRRASSQQTADFPMTEVIDSLTPKKG